MSTERRGRAWMEIDGAALRRNLDRMSRAAGGPHRLLPVVKSNAYGIGIEGALRTFELENPWGYGVAELLEAAQIRILGVRRPILVLSPLLPGHEEAAIEGGFRISVSSVEGMHRVRSAADRIEKKAIVHVEVDTGMGRAGIPFRDVSNWGPELLAVAGDSVDWEGVFTHFHSADAPEGGESVEVQRGRLSEVIETLTPLRDRPWILHACNSAAALRRPDASDDLVRPGIFLYGGRAVPGAAGPDPVVALRARVSFVREARAGTSLGYGTTYHAKGDERWATVAIGYADGLPRILGNRGHALVLGHSAPIVGRISMGMTVVDISDLPRGSVVPGDCVTFIGRDGDREIRLDEVAERAGTISYEILTGLSPALPRIWSESDDESAHSDAENDGATDD